MATIGMRCEQFETRVAYPGAPLGTSPPQAPMRDFLLGPLPCLREATTSAACFPVDDFGLARLPPDVARPFLAAGLVALGVELFADFVTAFCFGVDFFAAALGAGDLQFCACSTKIARQNHTTARGSAIGRARLLRSCVLRNSHAELADLVFSFAYVRSWHQPDIAHFPRQVSF